MEDLFLAAAEVKSPVAAPTTTDTVTVGNSLDILDSIDTIIANLQGARDFYVQELKAEVRPTYIERGMKHRCQPDNLKLETPSGATCSAEWKKRGTNSPLSDGEVATLKKHGIPVQTVVTQEAIEERFFFNNEVLADPELRGKVSEALAAVPELQGIQVLKRQPAVKQVTKQVVADSALNQMFAKIESPEVISDLMRIISCSVFKVQGSGDLGRAFKLLEKLGLGELVNKTSKTKK